MDVYWMDLVDVVPPLVSFFSVFSSCVVPVVTWPLAQYIIVQFHTTKKIKRCLYCIGTHIHKNTVFLKIQFIKNKSSYYTLLSTLTS